MKYKITKDSSFIHVKDKMHKSVTEHIIEEIKTKKLYHHVVSYGSWFDISYESVFMSHLLKELGVTGFGKAYIADDCEIVLPWYPCREQTKKSIVELPRFTQLEDVHFGRSELKVCDKFKETFISKTFVKILEDGKKYQIKADEILGIFGCRTFHYGDIKIGEEVYPLLSLLYDRDCRTIEGAFKFLQSSDITEESEILEVFEKYLGLDIEASIKEFEEETKADLSSLYEDLKMVQDFVRYYLEKYQTEKTLQY